MTLEAVYEGLCPRCMRSIKPKDKIEAMVDGSWVHTDCLRVGDLLKDGWVVSEMPDPVRAITVERDGE